LVFILAIVLGGVSFIAGLFASGGKLDVGRAFGIEANIEGGLREQEQEKK
jgi:hypothetical protein